MKSSPFIFPGIIFTALLFSGTAGAQRTSKYHLFRINHEGRTRTCLIHLPPEKFMKEPLPVLFCIHGGGGTAKGMIGLTRGRFNELADDQGFIVIYPQGIDNSWHDGRTGDHSTAVRENINDIGYFSVLIDEIQKKYPINKKKVFTCGISNGGFMSARLACEMGNQISGVAIVCATLGREYSLSCVPSKPVRMLVMNGTADPLVPYNGGYVTIFRKKRGEIISTDEFVGQWVKTNKSHTEPVISALPDHDINDGTRVEKLSYRSDDTITEIVLYRVINGGHTWPGGKKYLSERIIGKTSMDINACDEIWNFFKN